MGRHENPLDASAGPVAGLAGALRQLRHDAGSPPYHQMARRCSYSVATLSRAAAGKQLPTLAVLLAYVEACGGSTDTWEARWHHASEELTAQHLGQGIPPYKGLARFDHTDHALYFGRERLADDLWALTRRQRVAALLGPSGAVSPLSSVRDSCPGCDSRRAVRHALRRSVSSPPASARSPRTARSCRPRTPFCPTPA